MTTQVIKVPDLFPDSSEVPDSMSTNWKNDTRTEITNICRLRSQNATNVKAYAGKKQACRQVWRAK